jgi:argininosuccinate synthase
MNNQLIDNLSDFCASVKSCVTLYSGGLDSSWFLLWARNRGIRVVALHVNVGAGDPPEEVAARATSLGAEYHVISLTNHFADDFIAPAIRAGGLYQGAFPVCSSLSRPLMAETAVAVAGRERINCIVHTTTFVQNSAARFNNSVRALNPEIVIANPLIREPIQREQKRRDLAQAGIEVREGVYSVDQNIWGRVIECGELDDPANVVPPSVWAITADPVKAPLSTRRVTLGFERGIPITFDGQRMRLSQMIILLNEIGGIYGVGRYNGLEDTPLGIKNHEVRESPGAAAILTAHAAIERAALTQREIRVKSMTDFEWTELVTNGFWHTPLREALDALINSLSRYVEGEVILEFSPGSVFVAAVKVPRALHFWNVNEMVTPWFADFSYRQYFEISALPMYLRAGLYSGNKGSV